MWPCLFPSFTRLNLPFGHIGYADDTTVDDHLFVQYGKSPALKQVRDAAGIEPVRARFRDKMLSLAKAKIPVQCVCCCCSCCTASCWFPVFLSKFTAAFRILVEEYKPEFAEVGVKIDYFDKSGVYDYHIPGFDCP